MMKIIIKRIERAFALTLDLVEALSESDLMLKLENLPSNTISDQLWCVVGARESYLKAIEAGSWEGFSCSLKDKHSKEEIMSCLKRTSESLNKFLEGDELSEAQVKLLFDLLEHEVQHHGQLIRYVYANKLVFPQSWNNRYTV